MSFIKAIATVGGLTMGSRVLGFARDMLTAAYLGAGPVADAFFVALKLPNFFRRITAEGAFSVSFVPLFSGELEKHGKEGALKFAEEAQAVMLTILIPFTILMIAAMPWVLYVIAPGFVSTPARYDLALEMARITFPYILMMSLTALLGGVMNSFHKFGPFAAAPMIFNATLMAALVFLSPLVKTEGHAMAIGVAVAGVLQFLFLAWSCRRIHFAVRWRRPSLTPQIKRLFKLMLPGVAGAGVAQVNLFIDMVIASLLPIGSISYLYYADRIYQLPLSVIGIAIGTALLPMLSRALKAEKHDEARDLFNRAFEASLLLALPATLALLFIAKPLMLALFVRGEFTAENSVASAYALFGYALGLPAYILAKVFGVAYYAREDTATPVKFAIICAVANTALALLLITPLKHVGIAMATGLAAWVNLALLIAGLRKRNHLELGQHSVKRCLLILGSSVIMVVGIKLTEHFALENLFAGGQFQRLLALGILVAVGGVCYAGGLWAMGILRPSHIKALFPKRQKQVTISPEQ